MKDQSLAVIVSVFGVLGGCASTDHAADRQAINQVLVDWGKGWGTKNPELATAGYSDQADFTNAFGFHRVGQASIRELLEAVFEYDFVMGASSTAAPPEIRFIRDDVALVRSHAQRSGQKMPDGTEVPTRQITHHRVFVCNNGTWMIESHLISDANETQLNEIPLEE